MGIFNTLLTQVYSVTLIVKITTICRVLCPFKKYVCIYFRERKGEGERGGNIYLLPSGYPLLGIKSETKECALIGYGTSNLCAWDDAQPTEPHWSGHI